MAMLLHQNPNVKSPIVQYHVQCLREIYFFQAKTCATQMLCKTLKLPLRNCFNHRTNPSLEDTPDTRSVIPLFHFVQAHQHFANALQLAAENIEEIRSFLEKLMTEQWGCL